MPFVKERTTPERLRRLKDMMTKLFTETPLCFMKPAKGGMRDFVVDLETSSALDHPLEMILIEVLIRNKLEMWDDTHDIALRWEYQMRERPQGVNRDLYWDKYVRDRLVVSIKRNPRCRQLQPQTEAGLL